MDKDLKKLLSHLLYFDEGQGLVFSKLLEQRSRTPSVATLATQARSYGMGLVVLCQNPVTKIITEVLSNSANLICFHIGGTEVRGMAECMGLTQEQTELLQHLKPGSAIMKTNLGYTYPVQIEVKLIDITSPSDAEVEAIMRPVWNELLSKVVPVEKASTVNKVEEIKSTIKEQKAFSGEKAELKPDNITLLKDIHLRPYEFTENRYRQSSLTRNRAIRSKEMLCRLGFIEEVRIKSGRQGKQPTILRLTEKGLAYLGINKPTAKGSNEHCWWQHFAAYVAKKNMLSAKVENVQADVAITKDKTWVAVEISLTDSNTVRNAERNLKNGFNQVWFAVKDDEIGNKVKAHLASCNFETEEIKIFLLEELALQIKEFSIGAENE